MISCTEKKVENMALKIRPFLPNYLNLHNIKKKKKKKKFPPCIDCIISKMRREGRSLKKRNSKGKKNS